MDDSLSGSLFSVNTAAGLPVIEAFSDNRVNIGTFNREAIRVSGSFAFITGSTWGTSSWAVSASIAVSASSAPGFTTTLTQAIPATTWSFTHNLNTRNPIVQVYDASYNQIIPNQVVGVSLNLAEVRFDYPQNGFAVMSNGGGLIVTGSTSQLNQTVAAVTWSFGHNLNAKYINFEVYDSSDNTITPSSVRVIDQNNAEIYFSYPTTGTAVANFSGINGQMNAQTSSLALTASFVLPLRQTVLITGSFISSGSTQAFFGNLGLGTTTPSGGLHLNSNNFNTATSTSVFITDHGNNTTDGNEAARIQFQSRYWSNDDMINAVQSAIVHGKNAGNGNGGSFLAFHTTTRNTANIFERVRISSEGVGINKTSPSASLDVSGSMLVTGSFGMTGSYIQTGFTTLTTVSQSLNFANDAAAAAGGVPLGGLYRSGNFILIRLS